ncbi:MAG: heme-binding protein, partial [Deltaproteobacteria bacterium]|nr:heme-binding protein [Deltaproteobacteria bacterium]
MASLVMTLLLGILFFTADDAGAVEELRYQVLESQDPFEIRRYAPFVAVETLVEGDFDAAGETGFRRLFYFIAGHNRVKHPASGSAPARSEPESLMIPLTAPIFQERAAGKYRVYLPLPADYTLQALPEPLDPQVKLREIPARLMAAAWYTGTWGQEQYSEQLAKLVDWIPRSGLKSVGEPVYARYDSSYLWFLRRNEILIP